MCVHVCVLPAGILDFTGILVRNNSFMVIWKIVQSAVYLDMLIFSSSSRIHMSSGYIRGREATHLIVVVLSNLT